jgi:antibiotic biosynthesis monooxygenase (ABM) superfamily enzyme
MKKILVIIGYILFSILFVISSFIFIFGGISSFFSTDYNYVIARLFIVVIIVGFIFLPLTIDSVRNWIIKK